MSRRQPDRDQRWAMFNQQCAMNNDRLETKQQIEHGFNCFRILRRFCASTIHQSPRSGHLPAAGADHRQRTKTYARPMPFLCAFYGIPIRFLYRLGAELDFNTCRFPEKLRNLLKKLWASEKNPRVRIGQPRIAPRTRMRRRDCTVHPHAIRSRTGCDYGLPIRQPASKPSKTPSKNTRRVA